MSDQYYLAYEFTRAIVQKTASFTTATATDTFTEAGHGLANGTALTLADITGMANVAVNTTYYVVATATDTFKIAATIGGTAIVVGTGTPTVTSIKEYSFPWPNNAGAEPDNAEYTWEGGAQKRTLTSLVGVTVSFEGAAIPAGVHAEIFNKTTQTGSLPGGISNAVGYGGGDDIGGVSCGFRQEGYALKSVAGVETRVGFTRWFPQGTLTYTAPGAFQTGQSAGLTGYSFSAKRTAYDIAGGAIAQASAGGEFMFEGEI